VGQGETVCAAPGSRRGNPRKEPGAAQTVSPCPTKITGAEPPGDVRMAHAHGIIRIAGAGFVACDGPGRCPAAGFCAGQFLVQAGSGQRARQSAVRGLCRGIPAPDSRLLQRCRNQSGSYSTPVYVAGPGAKTVAVTQWNCQNYLDADLPRQWAAVPIPAYARPAYGTDAEMTIYQPSSDTMWEFWQARQAGGKWQACWGGKMTGVSKNEGIWPQRYGVAASQNQENPGAPYDHQGLGLWVVKRNIEGLGGDVSAHNRQGGGFEITVRLRVRT